MRKHEKRGLLRRLFSFLLAAVMVMGYIPATATAAETDTADPVTTKTADTSTWDRLETLYEGDTLHAGKVTVDKSVSAGTDGEVTVDGQTFNLTDENNFIVTVSQMAQVMALTTQMATPVDVVFVLDTSGSMQGNRATTMVTAANTAIKQLMQANENNRISVVAFSSAGYGGGTSNGAAANVLSPLAHYTDNTSTQTTSDDAASNHLRWTNSNGTENSGSYIMGRSAGNITRGIRRGNHDQAGGTNIQAGIALGAQQLTKVAATDTYITDAHGNKITRIPFIILLSDGAPTFSSTSENWYNPSLSSQNGDGNSAYTGNGFLAALTAAYYKGKITERYFGTAASDNSRCFVYTIGVAIQNTDLAELTLDPSGNYNADARDGHPDRFKDYWNDYVDGDEFDIATDSNNGDDYTVEEQTITDTKNYVNGLSSTGVKMYDVTAGNRVGGIEYNDGYYGATQTSEIAGIFNQIVSEISQKAISSPTQVSSDDHNFDGYVTFTDVIGEYMEVKDMKGILVGDIFYQGRYVAQNLGTNGENGDFDIKALEVIATRFKMANPTLSQDDAEDAATELINASVGAEYNGKKTQAYYTSATDYSNSLVWYGKTVPTDDGFEHRVQYIAPAVDDSYEYLTDPNSASAIATAKAAGADTVCRSYLFYGTAQNASGTQSDNNHEFMYFMVRVERSLVAPYQQTVTISAPASLLAVEKVYVTEDATGDEPTYSVEVEEANPAHVIYEVGLRSDINEYNIDQIVGADENYINETGNYVDGQYSFYTNDWNRAKLGTHESAMSKATFYAATNNPYYTYQEDTYLYVNGSKIKAITGDNTDDLYYERDVYSWDDETNADGEYTATKKTERITVSIPAGTAVTENGALRADADGYLYIAKGTYTAAVMSPDSSEEVYKTGNETKTSDVVAHPVRTGDANDSHYTVYLGNNGLLTMSGIDKNVKNVYKNQEGTNFPEADDDLEIVKPGDILTYTVKVVNYEDAAIDAVVTDSIPQGTVYKENSATCNAQNFTVSETKDANGVVTGLTWNIEDIPVDEEVLVSFKVEVSEDALTGKADVETINNTATIKMGNNPAYTTNTTKNPLEGKKAVDTNGDAITDTLKVGDIITYRVRYFNDNPKAVDDNGNPVTSNVTITDVIPAGTTYVPGSASHQEFLQKEADGSELTTVDGKAGLKWVIPVVNGESGVVSFRVSVDASAKVTQATETTTQPATGTIELKNSASIQIGTNNSRYTNDTTTNAGVGDISIKKQLAEDDVEKYKDKEFEVILTESQGKLNGTYQMTGGTQETAVFTNGIATVTIKHGQTLVIKGIPQGAFISVTENLTDSNAPGWSDAYDKETVTVSATTGNGTTPDITITNSYNPKPVTFQLTGTKTFVGANFPNATFTFSAEQCNEDGTEYSGTGTAASVSGNVTTDSSGQATFTLSGRTFYATTGPLYYIISEDSISYPGLFTDGKQYMLKLEIKDDGNGNLNAVTEYRSRANSEAEWPDTWTSLTWETDSTSISFTNEYPADGSVIIPGTKVLTNRNINANEFSFRLLAADRQTVIANAIAVGDGTLNTGSFSFNLTYTAADMVENGKTVDSKKFYYYVEEVNNSLPGVTYDKNYYKVEVTVSRGTGENVGKLVAAVTGYTKYTYTEEVGTDGTKTVRYDTSTTNGISFENEYESDSVTVKLSATKTLTVNDPTHTTGLAEGAFSFGVYRADANYNIIDSDNDGVTTDEEVIVGGTNTAGTVAESGYVGNVGFADLTYTHAFFLQNAVDTDKDGDKDTMTRYYVVKEIIPAENGPTFNPNMDYDEVQHGVKVVVTDAGSGRLSAQVYVNNTLVDASSEGVYAIGNFTNTLQASEIVFTPTGSKTTKGNNLPADLRFSFTVNSATVTDNKVTAIGGVAGTGVSNATKGQSSTYDTTQGVYEETTDIAFTELRFSDEDLGTALTKDFYYVIKESNTATGNGVDYDETSYLLTVTLKRDANTRVLSVDSSYKVLNADGSIGEGKPPSFTNTYAATGHINITAEKALSGDAGRTLGHREFDFELQRLGTDGKLVDDSEITGVNGELTENDGKSANLVTFATLNFTNGMLKTENGFEKVTIEDNKETEDVNESETYWLVNYLMSEVKPDGVAIPGITYDLTKYIVTIKVKQVTAGADSSLDVELYGVYAVSVNGDVYTATGENRLSDDEANANSTGETFTNYYHVSETSATIVASKELTGRALKAGEFTFELYRVDTAANKEYLVTTATNDADGKISFIRKYSTAVLSAGGFTSDTNDNGMTDYTVLYHLKEVNPAQGGVKHERGEYWIKVVIDHNTQNASYVVTSITYHSDAACQTVVKTVNPTAADAAAQQTAAQAAVRFVNKYQPAATSFVPTAQKELKDKEGNLLSISQNQFSFHVVELDSSDKTTELGVVSTGYSNAADNAAANVSFTAIGYSSAGTHYYKITENRGADSTITYDETVYYLMVTVTDNHDGTLSVAHQYYSDSSFDAEKAISGITFINHYGPGLINIDLELNKTVEVYDGENKLTDLTYPLEDSQFDFHVVDVNNNRVAHGTNDANGKISFTSIPITRADVYGGEDEVSKTPANKTFEYVVKEVPPSDSEKTGITIDSKKITAKVTVHDDGRGNLSITNITYEKEGVAEGASEANNATFVNHYTLKETSFTLTAHKTLLNKKLTEKEFQFKLEGMGIEKTEYNDENGVVNFGTFRYIRPGTYTYTVSEVDKGDAKYNCDQTVYKVVITVTPDTSGQLHAVPMYYKVEGTGENKTETAVGGLTFTNSYTPSPLTGDDSVDLDLAINATKQVKDVNGVVIESANGNDLLSGFKFEIVDITGKNIFGDGKYGTSNNEGKVIDFPKFEFKTAGEYFYTIREVNDAKPGYTYDTTEWALHILVSYNDSTGELYIDPANVRTFPIVPAAQEDGGQAQSDETDPVFVNIYNPTPADVTLTATKELTGRELKDREFTFCLMDNKTVVAEGHNNVNETDPHTGVVSFKLNYTIADMKDADGKILKEKQFKYQIEEVIPENAVGNKLDGVTYSKEIKYVTVTVKDEAGVLKAYVNNQTAAVLPSGAHFPNTYSADAAPATVVAQKTLEGAELKADQFTFEIVDSEDEVIAEGKNDANGAVRIVLPDFDKAGVYEYTLREVEGEYVGMVYDDKEYTVTVTVTDDLMGQLHATVAYDETPVFKNVYEGTSVSTTIEAEKVLIGRSLKDAEFTFELVDGDDKLVAPAATNNADGDVSFEVKFTQPGVYTYTIREKAGTDENLFYDTNTYKVTVTVTMDEKGNLSSKVAYDTTDGKAPVFRNVHTPGAVSVTLEGTKTLTGGTMKAEDFKFLIVDSDGKQVGTGTNTAAGKITFTAVAFDKAGKYELTVSEVDSAVKGMTYDTAKFKVTVEVTDTDGVLSAKVTYPEGGIKFANTYRTPDANVKVTLEGTKTLTGRKLKDEEFKFNVRDDDGKLVATGTNDADGKITFTDIAFTAAGKYELTVTEVDGKASNIIYDDAKFKVTVEVTDTNGVLTAKVTYPEDGVAFENIYKKPASDSPATGDSTPVGLLIVLMAVSLGAILLLVFLPRKNRKGKFSK